MVLGCSGCMHVQAREHTPREGDGRHVMAAEHVEIIGSVSSPRGRPSASPRSALGRPPAPQQNGPSRSTSAAAQSEPGAPLLQQLLSGTVNECAPETVHIGLPRTAAELAARGVEPLLNECHELWRTDFVLIALRRLLAIEALVVEAGLTPLRERTGDPRVNDVLRTENELNSQLAAMTDAARWTLFSSSSKFDIKTYIAQGKRLEIKVCGTLPHAIDVCCAPLLDAEAYSQWLPGVGFSTQLDSKSRFRKTIYARAMKVPIPFLATRDCVVTGYGDIYSPTSAIVYLQSVDDDAEFADEPFAARVRELSPPGQNVRMEIRGAFLFEVLDDGHTRLSANLQVDIKLKIVPPQVIDWFMKYIAGNLIPMYHKQANKFEPGGELLPQLRKGPDAETFVEMNRRLGAMGVV